MRAWIFINIIVNFSPYVEGIFQRSGVIGLIYARGKCSRVINTYVFLIVGTVDKGFVEVTNCFCVPHKEYEDQVSTGCLVYIVIRRHYNDLVCFVTIRAAY